MARQNLLRKVLRMRPVRDCCLGCVVAGAVIMLLFVQHLDVQPARTDPSKEDAAREALAAGAPAPPAPVVPAALAPAPAMPAAGAAAGATAADDDEGGEDDDEEDDDDDAAGAPAAPAALPKKRFSDAPMIDSRVYFPDMLKELGIFGTQGIEVGAAKGRFSDYLLRRWQPKQWVLIDPVLEPLLDENMRNWKQDPIIKSTNVEFLQGYSTDAKVLSKMPEESFDFIYIDAAHDYENVKKEMPDFWKRLRKGGLMAGHDYCAKKSSVARLPKVLKEGRPEIRPCGPYTDFAAKNPTKSGKIRKEGGEARDQIGVVQAVLEWLHEEEPKLELRATAENFTRESLARDNINYDDIITSTRNPSWYFFKPAKILE